MDSLIKKPAEDYHAVFRKVIRDVAEKLEKKYKMVISDSFAIIMVKLVALEPQHKFVLKQPLTRVEMERLVNITVEFITGMNPIQRNIIRMQLHYRGNHFPRAELIQAHALELENQVREIMHDLVENNPKDRTEVEVYYKKLTFIIITKADMGATSDPKVVRETEAALESVFPLEEVHLLVTMFPKEREREILNLVLMTTGIRLFNRYKDPEHFGAGIDDILKILPDKIFRCASILSEMRERSISRLIRYTTLIQPYFLDKNPSKRMGRRDISSEMLIIRQGLVMAHQLLMYIKELSDELLTEDESCDVQLNNYNECIDKLKEAVKDSASVPTLVVYPHFIALAQVWKELQNSLSFMETLIELVKALYEYSENDLVHVDPIVDKLIGSLKVPTEAAFFDFPKEKFHEDDIMPVAYRTEFTPNMDPLEMQYAGFCVWSFVKGLGLLMMGNPNIGVFHWRDKEFILASADAAHEFSQDPEIWIYKAILTARRWPELIFVLKLDTDVFNSSIRPEFDGHDRHGMTALKAMVSQDSGVQTELHPVESNIDHTYSWNEWEHRRRAVTLSKLYKCATHSSQTYKMSLRKNEQTQTYPMKNSRVQTMKETASEIPMSQFYFWGLRGCHEHPPHIVELSRDCALCLSCFVPPKKPTKKAPCLR